MTKKMLFIFNPHSGKGQIKNHLLDILDKFAKAEYDITVRPTQERLDAYNYIKNKNKNILHSHKLDYLLYKLLSLIFLQ